MRVTAIIAAAGRSKRFAPGTEKNKLEQDLGGRPVFLRSIELLANRPEVTATVVGVDPDRVDEVRLRWGDALGIRGAKIVSGGREYRWETIRNALAEVDGDATHIAVHDGARPCVSDELLDRLFEAAKLFKAVIPGVPVPDTLKRVSEAATAAAEDDPIATAILGDAGSAGTVAHRVEETVPRERLFAIQTPQVFDATLLRQAYEQSDLESTDDAMLIERMGESVHVILGETHNLKITTEADLELARAILQVKPARERAAHLRF